VSGHGAHGGFDFVAVTGWTAAGDVLGLIAAMLVAGLVGGFAHCAGMCGPFVLGQVTADLSGAPERAERIFGRMAGAALIPYHLGRMTTYTALGAVAGGLTGLFVDAAGIQWLFAALLVCAALFLAIQAFGGAGRFARTVKPLGGSAFALRLGRLSAPLIADSRGRARYVLGVALGFLPCGLLYAALAAAAGSGGALPGAAAMAAFTIGTAPSLIGVGYLGAFFGRRWLGTARRVARPLLLVNAVTLLWFAYRTLA
jgi:sulfite exporter TauE/SafE